MAFALTPVAGVCRNPLVGLRACDMEPVPVGVAVRSLAPDPQGGLLVCRLNGEWLLRDHWDELTDDGAVIEWHVYPQGREAIRVLLQVALVASYFVAPEVTPYLIAANAAYNLLVPPRAPNQNLPNQAPAGSIFSTSLAGNAARLDQPIWRICGRVKITPPFAAQPYTEYRAKDPANPTVDCDQYYYAVFAIGLGNHTIEKAFIGKTPISHFQDVLRAAYLPPGTLPSTALCNVITSAEVSSQLELVFGRYVGGYAACRPQDACVSIGVDVEAPQGLGTGSGVLTVTWAVQVRQIDDYGSPVGGWSTIANESRTADTNTPQRWSNTYTLSTPIRCEVRLARTSAKNTSSGARDGIYWSGLRGYLQRAAPLNAHCAHFEVVMRASSQLAAFSQRDFSMIVRALVRTWTPGGGWGAETFTRNAAWWLADLWTSSIWGEGLPDSRVDLAGLYAWSLTLDSRQDRFDFAFTNSTTSWDAAQLIAHSGRARAFRRGGVYTMARDEEVDIGVTALTPRNTQPKSMTMLATLPKREQADGYIVQYQSNVTWDTAQEECPCPGFSAVDPASAQYNGSLPVMQAPVFLQLDGVTGRMHAIREGLYQAASMAYRQTTVKAQVEMEGVTIAFMDPIRWMPQIHGYGQTGDVAFWDPVGLVMGLSEPVDWTASPVALTLVRDDGSLYGPIVVVPGPTAYDVLLPAAPDFTLVLDDGTRERPKFLLGRLGHSDELVKLTAIRDGGRTPDGAQLYDVEALIDDDRVHVRDNLYLPGPGVIQDPIDTGISMADVPFTATVNLAANGNNDLAHAVVLTGISPDWTLSCTMPSGGVYTSWSPWGNDGAAVPAGYPWGNQFRVGIDIGTSALYGSNGVGATPTAGRTAFGGATLTGSTSYAFWIEDTIDVSDNRGGLSILVTRL